MWVLLDGALAGGNYELLEAAVERGFLELEAFYYYFVNGAHVL